MATFMTATGWEPAQRTQVRACRVGRYLLIIAQGDLPNPGYGVDIGPNPRKIFPQQFNLLRRARPGVWPEVISPYSYGEIVTFPADQPVVVVHHADGQDRVDIQECGEDLREFAAAVTGSPERPCPAGAEQATGFSRNFSFDEAFTGALVNLSQDTPSSPAALTRIQVLEIGALVGEEAGLRNMFVRVCRTNAV